MSAIIGVSILALALMRAAYVIGYERGERAGADRVRKIFQPFKLL